LLALLLTVSVLAPCKAAAREFKLALPGYKYNFPRDHASHDEFKTEWWYYTGHLQAKGGRKFGYELTFFRTGTTDQEKLQSNLKADNVYLAHFAVTDLSSGKFKFYEKLNRAGLSIAGASGNHFNVFNENWQVEDLGGVYVLRAKGDDYSIHLLLKPEKDPVVHGVDGVSQKAAGKGRASHYYSMTRLKTQGVLQAGKEACHRDILDGP